MLSDEWIHGALQEIRDTGWWECKDVDDLGLLESALRELLAARKVVEALRSAEQLTPGTEHAQLAVKLMREISGTTLALAAYDAAAGD